MKKAIEMKLIDINAEMERMQTVPLYWLTEKWKILQAQRQVLGEILAGNN